MEQSKSPEIDDHAPTLEAAPCAAPANSSPDDGQLISEPPAQESAPPLVVEQIPIIPVAGVGSGEPDDQQQPPSICLKCGFIADKRVFTLRPPIQCMKCNQMFHFECIEAFRNFSYPVLLGDDFFQYRCVQCCDDGTGREALKRLHLSWPDILHLVIFHLTHSGYPTDHVDGAARFYQIKQDICPVIEEHWLHFWTRAKSDTWTNSIASALSTSAPHRFLSGKSHHGLSGWWAISNALVYPSSYEAKRVRAPQYDILSDGSLRKIIVEKVPKRVKSSNEDSGAGDDEDESSAVAGSVAKKARVKNSSTASIPKEQKVAKKKALTSGSLKKSKSKSATDERPLTLLYLDVPDTDEPVKMSRQPTHTAPQFKLEMDQLTVWNERGYRLCKASHGVTFGCWYYECEVLEPKSADGNLRIGWSQISGDLQAPCGFDTFSYSHRASPPSVFHDSYGKTYGCGYGPGDVLGIMISLPEFNDSERDENSDPLPSPWNPTKAYEQVRYRGTRPRLKGSEIRYFVNGKDQDVAFSDIFYGKYHPAVSSYMGGTVTVNFGETPFKFPPISSSTGGPYNYRPMSEARLLAVASSPAKVETE